jgi:phosphate transport system permease protein
MNKSVQFNRRDKLFKVVLSMTAIGMVFLLVAIFFTILVSSFPSIKEFGVGFIFSKEWDPINSNFGALPFIVGTVLSSLIALVISIPFSLAIALILGEYSPTGFISSAIRSMVELMAGVPSVIYGFWGLIFLVPIVRNIEISIMQTSIGQQIGILPYGVGIITAAFILAIMIIPYSSSVAREVISMVPKPLKEASFSLGATRFEVIKDTVIPYAKSGILAGILLSLGRAIGETMAVTMLIGNSNELTFNIFSPSNTMASVIANEFAEASEGVQLASLFEIGLILFVISFGINLVGRIIIKKMEHK